MKRILKTYNTFVEKRKISKWCIDYVCDIISTNQFTINSDMSISVPATVRINDPNIKELPYKFKDIEGDFIVSHSGLINMNNFPDNINGVLNLSYTKIEEITNMPNCSSLIINKTKIEDVSMCNCKIEAYNSNLKTINSNNIPTTFYGSPIYQLLCIVNDYIVDYSYRKKLREIPDRISNRLAKRRSVHNRGGYDRSGTISTSDLGKEIIYRLEEFDVIRNGKIDRISLESMFDFMGFPIVSEEENYFRIMKGDLARWYEMS